jgi:hypothetical protein
VAQRTSVEVPASSASRQSAPTQCGSRSLGPACASRTPHVILRCERAARRVGGRVGLRTRRRVSAAGASRARTEGPATTQRRSGTGRNDERYGAARSHAASCSALASVALSARICGRAGRRLRFRPAAAGGVSKEALLYGACTRRERDVSSQNGGRDETCPVSTGGEGGGVLYGGKGGLGGASLGTGRRQGGLGEDELNQVAAVWIACALPRSRALGRSRGGRGGGGMGALLRRWTSSTRRRARA